MRIFNYALALFFATSTAFAVYHVEADDESDVYMEGLVEVDEEPAALDNGDALDEVVPPAIDAEVVDEAVVEEAAADATTEENSDADDGEEQEESSSWGGIFD